MALEQSEEEEERVVEEGEEDLKIQGSCKRPNRVMIFVMDVLDSIHVSRGACDRVAGCRIAATSNLQEQAVDRQSSHYHHNSSSTTRSLPRKGSWR